MPVSVIILAAGSSSRMGQSKQLLPWKDGTLLSHAIQTAMNSKAGKVYVVAGKDKDLVKDFPVSVVINESWEKGIGSSIKAGVKAAKDSEAILLMTCDMPFVASDHLNNIIEHYIKTNQKIVASKYLGTIGIPALFSREMFDELMMIGDDEGAKKIISNIKYRMSNVDLKSGTDIDTPEDYYNALSN
jgi:molybdenum cofactor cytidylyltransferase